MQQFWSFLFVSVSTLVFAVNSAKEIKCYLCNSAYPTLEVTEETCRNPSKRPDFKPVKCTETVLRELNKGWMNEEWIQHSINANDNNHLPNYQRSKRETHWQFGYEKKDGYELKCMKEVLHRESKPWLAHKPENFSQVVRFCEYKQVKPKPDNCEETCDKKQLSETGCYICCTGDGCNHSVGLSTNWKILSLSVIFTFPLIARRC